MSEAKMMVRLGARGSMLSRMQSGLVAAELEKLHPGLKVELVIVKTSGDTIQDRPLHEFGGKGLFTKELELALLAGAVDFAVHSFKDVPVTMPLVEQQDLVMAAVPAREDGRDVLASAKGWGLRDLPPGARVGTGSLRRAAQVLALRPDVVVLPIRGNVDTRLRKLREVGGEEYDAVVLAMAGLKRSGLFDGGMMRAIEPEEMLGSAGQGALALQCRKADGRMRELLGVMNDAVTALCVGLEREIVLRLNGDCHSPIAALAEVKGERVRLRAAVAGRDGRPPVVRAGAEGEVAAAPAVVVRVIEELERQGARSLLSEPR